MYEFFGLTCEPFSVAADPRFIYMSPQHRQAMAHLGYGLRRGAGFILLTGEIGAGKTTVFRLFLRQLAPSDDVALVVNPQLDSRTLLTRICEDLRIDLPVGTIDLVDAIHGHLLLAHAQGRRTLIVVDEAQALALPVLEQLRLLSNLDTSGGKLQVFLIGQPELRGILRQSVLEPLAQRVVARFHLAALPERETALYIAHRLSVAGLSGPGLFDREAIRLIHRLCAGVPRRINVLCDRALHVAESLRLRSVTQEMVEQAALDVFDDTPAAATPSPSPPDSSPITSMASAAPPPPASAPSDRARHWPAFAAVAAGALIAGFFLVSHYLRPDKLQLAGSMSPSEHGAAAPAPAPPEPPAIAPPSLPNSAPVEAPAVESHGAAPARALPAPSRVDTIDDVFQAASANESEAWRDLANLWGAKIDSGAPCAAAARLGLRCYRTTGGLAVVRQLNRPGLLKLAGADGRITYALLIGIADSSVTFAAGAKRQIVPLSALAGRWHGEFATLWRPPPGYRAGDSVNTDQALSNWFAQTFATRAHDTVSETSADTWGARLFAFQLAHGLQPDGRLGPLTLMQLNRASGVDEPQLLVDRQ